MVNLGDWLEGWEIDEMIRQAEVDKNGLVKYEEYVKMMSPMLPVDLLMDFYLWDIS